MTRETKMGLVVGLAFIILFAVIISDSGPGGRGNAPARFGASEQAKRGADSAAGPSGAAGEGRLPVDRALSPPRVNVIRSAPPPPPRPTPTGGGHLADAAPAGRKDLPVLPLELAGREKAAPAGTAMNPAAPNSSSALAAKPPPLVVPRPMESGRQAPPEAAIAQNPAAGLVSGAQTGTKDADPKSPRADPRFAEAKRAAELQKKLDVASATKPPASPDSPAGKQLDGGGKLAATPATPRGPDLKPPDGKARPDRRTYAIQSGDSLSLIARKYYGKDSTLFVNMIYDANRDVLRDRHALKIGQKLVIPANPPDDRPGIPAAASNSNAGQGRPVGSPRIPKSLDSGRTAKSGAPTELVAKPKSGSKGGKPVEPKARTYQVRQNDTLGKIAARLLGDSSRSDELYRLNRDRLKNKHDVSPGTVLRLPPKTASAAKGADPGRGAAASSARGA